MRAVNQPNDLTRREVLMRGVAGAAGMALLGTPGALALPAQSAPATRAASRAGSVIQIWMWGGPAHLDTFDPKPEAGGDYCGPLNKPIDTNVDGLRIGQLLPLLAKQADKYAVIRSMTHGVNAHETASYLVQTGRQPDRLVYPGVGAVISLFKGYDHGYRGAVAPYIVLTEAQGRFSEVGFLGQRYKPFATGGDPNAQRFAVEGIIAQGITELRQRSRRELLESLETFARATPKTPRTEPFQRSAQDDYDLMFGEARKIFDLSAEKKELRDRYGRNTFGLMARRLVEHGVPYITINYKGWDTHKQHFQTMNRKLPEMDQGMAALLEDLSSRGLLDRTIVWWGGEFGRTPRVQWEPPWNGGRGHHGACFSAVVAGGGFKGGTVVGQSDEHGMNVADRPVSPRDLIASIYTLLGIDPEGVLPNPRGIETRLLPPVEEGAESGGLLREIMAV
ncbi:MAG: DUF1501 domain-containing protein [Planctomycetes bacterium]|nr:DUF1501 domain-containing protein [Planctomycetota bacterium]